MDPSNEILLEIDNCSEKLRQYIQVLLQKVAKLSDENAKLKARLNQNPTNSSKPPSTSPFIKPKSLREKTGRKPGGQPGHKGKTIRVSKTPDKVIEHSPDICDHCGCDISMLLPIKVTKRQVIDVRIIPIVIDHNIQSKLCPVCDKKTTADHPKGVDHYIQYGNTFSAIMICLNKGNYVPYERLSYISKDIFGLNVSTGTLVNIVHECGKSLDESMQYIKDQLKKAAVVHFDETGNRTKGKNRWLHSAGNELFTYLQTHEKRGSTATDDIGILPEFEGTAIHDFWKSYYNYNNCKHGLCNSHILRELTGITENFDQIWSRQMKTLLIEIKQRADSSNGELKLLEINCFNDWYDELLSLGDKENPIDVKKIKQHKTRGRPKRSKARNLLDRMKLYKEDILRFMIDPEVDFSNNRAERDLRMSKLYQKISGGFRSIEGNEVFDNIRSYISTASKHGISMSKSINAAVSGSPLFTSDDHQLY